MPSSEVANEVTRGPDSGPAGRLRPTSIEAVLKCTLIHELSILLLLRREQPDYLLWRLCKPAPALERVLCHTKVLSSSGFGCLNVVLKD